MRIAYVFDHRLPSTGADTEQLVHMVSALGEEGADVTLVLPRILGRATPTPAQLAAYYGVAPSFRVTAIPGPFPTVRPLEKPAHALAGALLVRRTRADLVYTRNLPTALAVRAALGPPVLFETYRPWPRQYPATRPLFSALARAPGSFRMVLHSRYAMASFLAAGFPADRMLVAHNGWDPRKFEPRLSRTEARRRLGLPLDRPLVVYTGRVTPKKGLLGVLDMARALPEADFLFVGSEGDGPVERAARSVPNVSIVGWTDPARLPIYLYAADVLLIPPTTAPLANVGNTVLPIKTFAYLAAGRAIFAPASPDLAEILRHEENAFLVPPDDWPAATRGLRRLLGDPALAERIARGALEQARGGTWRRRAQQVLAFAAPMT